MYVCMYVCVCIGVFTIGSYVCMYVCMCVCMYVCVCIGVFTIGSYVCMCVCVYACVYVCMCVYWSIHYRFIGSYNGEHKKILQTRLKKEMVVLEISKTRGHKQMKPWLCQIQQHPGLAACSPAFIMKIDCRKGEKEVKACF